MRVAFLFDFARAHAALLHLASKMLPAFDKGKACKLLFLADKLHLVRYGRPITGDEYWALEHGPVPSKVLKLLNDVEGGPATSVEAKALTASLELDRTYAYPRLISKLAPDHEQLSKSDVEALDRIAELHGSKTFAELRALTHQTVAYQRAWSHKAAKKGSARMAFEDFFEEDSDARAGAREEMLENAALKKSFSAR
jgi:uncharacterized phage-associated protein